VDDARSRAGVVSYLFLFDLCVPRASRRREEIIGQTTTAATATRAVLSPLPDVFLFDLCAT
jgi:hypothetical protein